MDVRQIAALAMVATLACPIAVSGDPLSVFQPAHVRAVSITAADERAIRALPPLGAFGSLRGTNHGPAIEVRSANAAARKAGFALRLPERVPAALGREVHYAVTERRRIAFTFDRAKAAAWAREHKVAMGPFPAGLDGATSTVSMGPVVIVTYGTLPSGRRSDRGARRVAFLVLIQTALPTVTTRGASLRTLEEWFAQQPGISPSLAAQVRAIGDPMQTLPVPIRVDKQTATQVTVDGVQGLAIGDETGIGSTIEWTKGGKLYGLGGTVTLRDALALANALR